MKKTIKTSHFDVADYLKTEDECAAFLDAVIEESGDDASLIASAVGTVARARGMMALSQKTGIGRESLYRSFDGKRSPTLGTFLKTIHALGMQMHIAPMGKAAG